MVTRKSAVVMETEREEILEMSLKIKENALKQAEELLAAKDRRIKELERLLLKAQMLLHNAGVTDVLKSSIDGTGYDRTVEEMRMQKKPDSHQVGATASKRQSDQLIAEGSVDIEQPQNSVRTTEYSKSSQETHNMSSAVVELISAVPVNVDASISFQPPVVTHTPSSKVSISDTLSTEMSTRVPATSAAISSSNRTSLTISTSPKIGEMTHADTSTVSASSSISPCRIMVVPVTTRECLHVSSVTTSCSSYSTVPSIRSTDSPRVTPTVNNSSPACLNSVADGTSPSSDSPLSTSIVTVPLSATTSGSFISTCDANDVTLSMPGTTSSSSVSTFDANSVTVPLPGTTSSSFISTSNARVVTMPLLATTSGSSISTASDNIVTVQLPATTSTDHAAEDFTPKNLSTQATGTCKASVAGESSYPSFSVSERNQVALADTNSVFSSTDPKMTSAVDGSTQDTSESARTVGEANLKGQLPAGEGAIYFTDDLENFNIAQEETVSMESDTSKQDDDDNDVDEDEETFVPPADLQSIIGKGCKTHGKCFPDIFDFACHDQNRQSTNRHQQNLCGECGKTFASKRILRQHVKIIHESEQTYLCNVCQKVFRHVHNLNIHKQNQNHFSEGEEHLVKDRKIFKCGVCHRTFRQKSNMQDHVRLHSGERPFGCSYCDRRFAQISNCRKHELTHTGKRPHSCDQCHKTFTSSSNLKRHHIAHALHKNYLCPICGKAFTQKWNLTKHERKHKACHKSESSESILLSKSEADEVISSPAIEVKVVHIL